MYLFPSDDPSVRNRLHSTEVSRVLGYVSITRMASHRLAPQTVFPIAGVEVLDGGGGGRRSLFKQSRTLNSDRERPRGDPVSLFKDCQGTLPREL